MTLRHVNWVLNHTYEKLDSWVLRNVYVSLAARLDENHIGTLDIDQIFKDAIDANYRQIEWALEELEKRRFIEIYTHGFGGDDENETYVLTDFEMDE